VDRQLLIGIMKQGKCRLHMVMLIYTYELSLHIVLYARYVIINVAMVTCPNLLNIYNYISINYYIFIIELLFVSINLELIKYKI